ncbi:MAG: transcription termination/antitermination protein NusA, partial [Gammaproteobacteria bacterium]|nr:transcription termination/antitermination protein NusA [Gammaproteobacteria bacterium]
MSKEILLVVDAIANEKGVEQEVIFEAIEAALASATEKRHDEEIKARVSVDRKTGEYETARQWFVVDDDEEIEFPEQQIPVTTAQANDSSLNVGDVIEEPLP